LAPVEPAEVQPPGLELLWRHQALQRLDVAVLPCLPGKGD
jgi:hypothetical protein